MDRREFLKTAIAATAATAGSTMFKGCLSLTSFGTIKKPNIVIIFTDDQGYADAGCFGAEGFQTPNIDRMAAEGMRFTDFYVGSSVCSPSRAALLTGCYPLRNGLISVLSPLRPEPQVGINSNEVTIAEMLKPQGYATACFGKWHLGHHKSFLPLQHGFDEYFGLPYSNDMWPPASANYPDLPLIEGEETIELNPDQSKLTTWYTEHAVRFIEKNKDNPFFLYVPHSMAHVPLHVSNKFKGKSEKGLYGDVAMEIDWSVGQILETLKRLNIDRKTLVIFTADNGPWLSYGSHAGSAKPLREGKFTTFEGGFRELCVMRWPGRIPAGTVCRELATTMDILPTVARLTGAQLPAHKIDGKDIWLLMSGKRGAKTPHEAFFYYRGSDLEAVRSGKWKLHFPHKYQTLGGRPTRTDGKPIRYGPARIELSLFDLQNDISEQNNVAAEHPDVVKHLSELADQIRHDIGDTATGIKGQNVRPLGRLNSAN